MKSVTKMLVVCLSVLLSANLAFAQEDADKKKKKGRRAPNAQLVMGMVRGLELDDQQKAKLQEVAKEFAPRFKELRESQAAIITKEQQKAAQEAVKAARAEGKNRRELMQARQEALKLTEEQKEKMKELGKKQRELLKEIRERMMTFLTEEQKEQLSKRDGKRRTRAKANADN